MLDKSLEELGLSKNERKVYLAMLERRRATPPEVAKLTRINRTTVYSLLKGLVGKGLLAEDLGGKKKTFVPVSPQKIERIIQEQARELKERAKAAKELARALSLAGVGTEYTVPKIRFVEEQDIRDFMHDRNKAWNESIRGRDKMWWGFQDHSFVESYRDWDRLGTGGMLPRTFACGF